ncbi:hypothetical protein DSO57_1017950 [Entomophthora muscae]|uniref:Uncharacterized protein n=1 Tax=Entomophthora muscae TaxID=34485 RepID=A0ACC2TSX7_9FUNG|nr:hypothetical protein DSO57_1017950 [Entomophthora muscae]
MGHELFLLKITLESEAWAGVLIPGDFSLLQLHLLLLDVLGFQSTRYQTHAFHQPNPNYTEYQIASELVCQSPHITYQTIAHEECEGWVTELGPGAFVEHSNPRDPSPAFSVGKDEPALLAMRQLRDERIYSLDAAFQVGQHLHYDLDSGTRLDSCQISLLARSAIPNFRRGLHRPPLIVACHSSPYHPVNISLTCKLMRLTPTRLAMDQLKSIQNRIDATHQEIGSRCYICRHPSSECWVSGRWGSCSLHNPHNGPCCELCPAAESTLVTPLSELIIAQAWANASRHLIQLRIQFLTPPLPISASQQSNDPAVP